MNQHSVIVAAAVLVVLILLAVWGNRPDSGGTTLDMAILPRLSEELGNVESIEIRKASNEPVATLQRSDAGWTVLERDSYPANVGTIRDALTALAEARIVEAKTANPDFYDRLGVEPIEDAEAKGVAITLHGPGVDIPAIILGNSEGSDYRYARLQDEAQSYLINRDPETPTETAQWLEPQIIDVNGSRVEKVTIIHDDGEPLEIFKTDASQSNFSVAAIPEGRELQYPGVANVIGNSLRDLQLEDVAAAGPEQSESTARIEFDTFDGLVVRIQSIDVDDENWLTFAASASSEQPVPQADEIDADDDAESEAPAPSDPVMEAERINTVVSGWRYRIPSYKYDQITRRLDDLLAALPADESEP